MGKPLTLQQAKSLEQLWAFYCSTLAEDKVDGSPFDFRVQAALRSVGLFDVCALVNDQQAGPPPEDAAAPEGTGS